MSNTYAEQLEQEVARLRTGLTAWIASMQNYTDLQYGKGKLRELLAFPDPTIVIPSLPANATPEEMVAVNKLILTKLHAQGVHVYEEDAPRLFHVPCAKCPFDGVYRCSSCAENGFEGFNQRHYPENKFLGEDASAT